jgi:ABC-2 type transport system ATP-binding protein
MRRICYSVAMTLRRRFRVCASSRAKTSGSSAAASCSAACWIPPEARRGSYNTPMPSPFLELRDLRKSYGATRALDGVSFTVKEGAIFGLLGPNGAGKSTLLSIVSGLLAPDGGAMFLAGAAFVGRDRQRRRLLGLAPQELALYHELTARENLRFFGELYGLGGARLRERIDAILHAVGLSENADARVAAFSGGMKRRLNLGAALVHEPRLLLLDEPTAGVDAQSRNHIFEEVRRLHAQGTTIIYTTHYMEEVQALCPEIAILDHGKLIAHDTLAGLLRLLPGRVRFRLAAAESKVVEELKTWEGVAFHEEGAGYTLESANVQKVVLQLATWAHQRGLEIEDLHMEEPNLERVFLHLTGRQLRD